MNVVPLSCLVSMNGAISATEIEEFIHLHLWNFLCFSKSNQPKILNDSSTRVYLWCTI